MTPLAASACRHRAIRAILRLLGVKAASEEDLRALASQTVILPIHPLLATLAP